MSETLRINPEDLGRLDESALPCTRCGTPVTRFTVAPGDGTHLTRVLEMAQDPDDPGLIHLAPHACEETT